MVEALFAELERDPTNVHTTLVLADALTELDDARADLMHVQHALATVKGDRAAYLAREAAMIHALRGRLIGPAFVTHPEVTLEVRLGFARTLALVNRSADEVTKILATALPSPEGRLLESLELAWTDEEVMGLGQVFRWLAGSIMAPASLRRIVIGNQFGTERGDRMGFEPVDFDDDDDDDEATPPAEDLRQVLTVFPRVRELVLDLGTVPVELPTLATKNLESFTWITPRLTADEVAPLGSAILPGLTYFELWLGGVYGHRDGELRVDEEPGDDLDVLEALPMNAVEPVLAMLDRCTQLREVVFGHAPALATLLARVPPHPFAARLERFGLSHLVIDDADPLLDFVHALPNLKKVVLEDVYASERAQSVIERKLGTRLVASWADEPLQFRYVTGYE